MSLNFTSCAVVCTVLELNLSYVKIIFI